MAYTPTNWQDRPSTATPVSATNLNKMEAGIAAANVEAGVTVPAEDSALELTRIGHIVQARISVDQAPSTSFPVDVPLGYRPVSESVYRLLSSNVQVQTNGVITFNPALGSGGGTFLWLTSDEDPS